MKNENDDFDWAAYERRMWWFNKWLEFLHEAGLWLAVVFFYLAGGLLMFLFFKFMSWWIEL